MRAPPPVEFKSASGRAWRGALALLVGASVAVPFAWGLPYAAALGDGRQPAALFEALGRPLVQGGLAAWVAAMAAAASWLAGRRAAMGGHLLRWDGEDWVLAGDGHARPDRRGDATLMLDLGSWMLVRFMPVQGPGPLRRSGSASRRPARPTWLPLAASGDPARWAALRGALWNWRPGRGDARP